MAYKVVTNFFDIEDNKHLYEVGQSYPRAGVEVTQKRIDYLLNKNNELKSSFIKYVEDQEEKVDYSHLTKDQIKSKLDELGVEYDSKVTKVDLFDLLVEALKAGE